MEAGREDRMLYRVCVTVELAPLCTRIPSQSQLQTKQFVWQIYVNAARPGYSNRHETGSFFCSIPFEYESEINSIKGVGEGGEGSEQME